MSFSTQVKDSIINQKIKNKCCKKAFMYGACMASSVEEGILKLSFSHKGSADLTEEIARYIFKIKNIEKSSVSRGVFTSHSLSFLLPTAISLINEIDNGEDTSEAFERIFDCDLCLLYFFCGAFCATGSVSDPEKSYTAELLLPNERRANAIKEILEGYTDLIPHICKRKKGYSVFFRNSENVGGFLSLLRVNNIVFDFFNIEFQNQERAKVQRATTFVATNIQRTVSANRVHLQAIQRLIDHDRFYMLPDDLRVTATLRMENPELSLKALASLHTPPITKSGLNHRLEKIIAIAEEIAD